MKGLKNSRRKLRNFLTQMLIKLLFYYLNKQINKYTEVVGTSFAGVKIKIE